MNFETSDRSIDNIDLGHKCDATRVAGADGDTSTMR